MRGATLRARTSPAEGEAAPTATPTIVSSYSEVGTGVDTATLEIKVDGQSLSVSCTFGQASTTCTPGSPLASGPHTLHATIADFEGNPSAPDEVSFTVGGPANPGPNPPFPT